MLSLICLLLSLFSLSLYRSSSIGMSSVVGTLSIFVYSQVNQLRDRTNCCKNHFLRSVAAISILSNSVAVWKNSSLSYFISSLIVCASGTVGSIYGSSVFI